LHFLEHTLLVEAFPSHTAAFFAYTPDSSAVDEEIENSFPQRGSIA
jgi:hypothetical protein